MTADVELLPCPCGASAKIYPTGTEIGPREKLVASCDDPECQWSMIGFGPEQVAERWNRRANAEASTEKLRAEVEVLRISSFANAAVHIGIERDRQKARAERLAEALREWMEDGVNEPASVTVDRTARTMALLHPTAAQEGK